jgi:2-polyprenyl-6-methoxyphenol hydroxylase-like FAD-dependent oxidoreductase
MQNDKTIAIIGGGPGGLTLARVLSTRGIAATVFELDEHALARPQGGTLDLHEGSGLLALRHAGLAAGFKALARYEDQEGRIYDTSGALRFADVSSIDRDRPEIDRTQLRDLLIKSLPTATIRWGSKVRAVSALAAGRHRVSGDKGPLGDFDLVVGADGAWSIVRPLVSPMQPSYGGVTFIELGIDDVDRSHPEVASFVGHGKASVHGDDGRGTAAASSRSATATATSASTCPSACPRVGWRAAPSTSRHRHGRAPISSGSWLTGHRPCSRSSIAPTTTSRRALSSPCRWAIAGSIARA